MERDRRQAAAFITSCATSIARACVLPRSAPWRSCSRPVRAACCCRRASASDPCLARIPHCRRGSYCSDLRFEPHRTTLTSAHAQATTKMGEDERRTTTNSRGESRDDSQSGDLRLIVVPDVVRRESDAVDHDHGALSGPAHRRGAGALCPVGATRARNDLVGRAFLRGGERAGADPDVVRGQRAVRIADARVAGADRTLHVRLERRVAARASRLDEQRRLPAPVTPGARVRRRRIVHALVRAREQFDLSRRPPHRARRVRRHQRASQRRSAPASRRLGL